MRYYLEKYWSDWLKENDMGILVGRSEFKLIHLELVVEVL